jgi:hypothetical protein
VWRWFIRVASGESGANAPRVPCHAPSPGTRLLGGKTTQPLNDSLIVRSQAIVGEGADSDTRGRACSPIGFEVSPGLAQDSSFEFGAKARKTSRSWRPRRETFGPNLTASARRRERHARRVRSPFWRSQGIQNLQAKSQNVPGNAKRLSGLKAWPLLRIRCSPERRLGLRV